MTALPFHNTVKIAGIADDEFTVTFNLASSVAATGSVAGTIGDEGKAVTLDVSAANTVKLAGDNDRIIGRLETTQARSTGKTGAVALQGILKFPYLSTESPVVGDTVVGSATLGSVKVLKASGTPAPDWSRNIVTEVDTTNKTVTVYFR